MGFYEDMKKLGSSEGQSFSKQLQERDKKNRAQSNAKKATTPVVKTSQTQSTKKANTFYEDHKIREVEKAVASKPIVGLNAATPGEAISRVSGVKTAAHGTVKTPKERMFEGAYKAQPLGTGSTFVEGPGKGKVTSVGSPSAHSYTNEQLAEQAYDALYSTGNTFLGRNRSEVLISAAERLSAPGSGYENTPLVKAIKEEIGWSKRPVQNAAQNFAQGFSSTATGGVNLLDAVTGEAIPFIHDMAEVVNKVDTGNKQRIQAANGDGVGYYAGMIANGLGYMASFMTTGGLKSGGEAVVKGASKVARFFAKTLKNPSFYTSFINASGNKYKEERNEGVDKFGALTNAGLTGIATALTEVVGGIGANEEISGSVLKTILEEIIEEEVQNPLEALIDKLTTHRDTKWFSMDKGERSVINPMRGIDTALVTAVTTGVVDAPRRFSASGRVDAGARKVSKETERAAEAIANAYERIKREGLGGSTDARARNAIEKARTAERNQANRMAQFGYMNQDDYREGDYSAYDSSVQTPAVRRTYNGNAVTFDDVLNYTAKAKPQAEAVVDTPNIESNVETAESSDTTIKTNNVSPEIAGDVNADGEVSSLPPMNETTLPQVTEKSAPVVQTSKESKLGTAKAVADILTSAYGMKFAEYSAQDGLNGYYDPETRTAYINQASDDPVLSTVSHETLHDLKVNDRGAFMALRKVVNSDLNISKFNQYKKELLATYDSIGKDYSHMTEEELYEHVLEEAMADLCSEVMRDPDTIRRIANADRTLAQKIMDTISEILDRIVTAFSDYFGGQTAEVRELVNNFEQVQRVYQAVLENTAKKGSMSEGVRQNDSFDKPMSVSRKQRAMEDALDSDSGSVIEYSQQNLSESGEVNVSTDAETLGERRARGNNDSVWQQGDGSETAYRRMAGTTGDSRASLERGRGLIDWSGRLQSYDLSSPREKKRAYGLLREISERRIGNTDAEGRTLPEDVRDYFSNTVLKNEKGELIPLFHATDGEFTVFEKGDFGFHVGSSEQAITRGGRFIKEVYVNLKNPLIIPEDRGIWPALVVADEALRQGVITRGDYNSISKMEGFYEKRYDSPANASLRRLLKWKEHDGIVYPNKHEGEGVSAMVFDPEQIKYVSNQAPTKNPDLRFSVSRKQRATEAIAKYKETGDVRDLPDRAWAKGFRRDTENRSRYLANQMQDLEYQLTYADEESRKSIEGALAVLREKIKAASESAGIAVELNDVLDNATLNRNVEFAPVIGELKDTDTGLKLKNGNYRFNDFYRNMERFFGKHFHLVKPLVDSFDSAKGDFARMQAERLAEAKQYIVKELGIKPGSKESKAVQWIGEKQRNPLTKKEVAEIDRIVEAQVKEKGLSKKQASELKKSLRVDYTEAMLRNEFDEETVERILKAERWFRQQYEELIDEINRTQRLIYPNRPDKQIPKRQDYMRHFREMETGFRGLRNIFDVDNNIDPSLVLVSDHTKPKEKWASIKQQREGNVTDEGAIEGFLDYLPQAAYAIHINPYIDKFRGLARDIAELKAENGDTSANGFIKYLNDFASHIAGKSSAFDRAVIDTLGSNGRKFTKTLALFNNRVKSNAVLGNLGSVSKQVMNIPNGVELLHNPARIFQGIGDVLAGLNQEGKARENYKKSDFLAERFLDKSYSQLEKNGLSKGAQWLLGVADEFGTRAIWNAAYREGVALHDAGEITATPERYADVLTRRAVAGRGVGEVPLAYQSQIGKLVLPFQVEVSNTWNVKRDVLSGKAQSWGEKSTYIERASREAIGLVATFALGALVEALTGSKGAFDPLGDILDGILQGWKEEEDEELWDKIVKMSQRSAQNVAGDFIGSRSFGWVLGEFLSMIDEDWATKYFNDSVFQSQGANVPAVQSVVKGLKDFKDGDWVGGVAELSTSFLTPFGGKQIDKTVRGVADYMRGGKYQNDIYKELSTGERGDKRYDIPKTAGNFAKSALFGPSALSEGQDYWDNKKLEGYAQTETKQANTRAKKQFAKDYNKAHPDSEVETLYREVKDFSVYPFSPIKENQDFDRDKKEYTLRLLPAELEKYQTEQNRRMQENYEAVFKTDAYRNASAERKMELLEDARREAETTVRQMIQNDYLYKDNKAYGRFLTEGEHIKRTYKDATNYSGWSEYSRASSLLSYAKAAERDGVITSAGAKALQEELGRKQTWTALDEELYRITSEGLETQLMYNAYNVFSFTKNKQEYRINVPAGDLAKVFSDMETRFRSKLNQTIGTASYQNASLKEKQDMITDAKSDVRKVIREELKKKYGYSLDDDFAKIVRMK